ncbi:MAG: HPr family phosphocarrier protein [Lachnospiraceae bacterium]|nr:HPr family phosphocarrier protein [Lachnospiraceae bacterium]
MEKLVQVNIPGDVDARPIAMLVQVASQYDSTIYLETSGKKVNAKSIMGMMSLALKKGDSVNVLAEGSDESSAIEGIEKYLSNDN